MRAGTDLEETGSLDLKKAVCRILILWFIMKIYLQHLTFLLPQAYMYIGRALDTCANGT